MRVAITGASGFVGHALAKRLEADGHEVLALTRRAGTSGAGLREFVTGPLENTDSTTLAAALREVDAVAHLAALTHLPAGSTMGDEMFHQVNVTGTQALIDAAARAGVRRFVLMSSIKVNGEETAPGQVFSGSDAPSPEDAYGRTKLEAEKLVTSAGHAGRFEVAILRPPLVYGLGVKGNFERLVAAVRRGVPLPFGLVDNRRSLISVRNLADVTIAALSRPGIDGLVATVSDDEEVSTSTLVKAIGDAIGRPARLLPVPLAMLELAGRIVGKGEAMRRLTGDLRVDASAAMRALDWAPRDRLLPALRAMLGFGASSRH